MSLVRWSGEQRWHRRELRLSAWVMYVLWAETPEDALSRYVDANGPSAWFTLREVRRA